jgi:hypothetical protein|tara:strand:+ start:2299 stop:2418 length:120 start_codon:yes stop_codon:yes gene_type:complete
MSKNSAKQRIQQLKEWLAVTKKSSGAPVRNNFTKPKFKR